jgi:hypothetical protein
MKNSKIITYCEPTAKNGHGKAPMDSIAIFSDGMFIGYRHISDMPFAVSPDRSVFKKTEKEKQDLKAERSFHKTTELYNPRPASYITITQ